MAASLVVVSDASGEEQLEIHVDGETHPLPGDIGRVTDLRAAPHGRRIALANHRNELWLVDLDKSPGSHRDAAVFSRIDHSTPGAAKTWPGRPTVAGWPIRSQPACAIVRSSCIGSTMAARRC